MYIDIYMDLHIEQNFPHFTNIPTCTQWFIFLKYLVNSVSIYFEYISCIKRNKSKNY